MCHRAEGDRIVASIDTILCPTDFSGASTYALRMAYTLARENGARVIVLHVIEGAERPVDDEGRKFVRKRLGRIQSSYPAVCLERRVREGNPSEEIVRLAAEDGCDFIVLGTHGQGGPGREVLGRVAEHVLRNARCPVLVVKGPADAAPRP